MPANSIAGMLDHIGVDVLDLSATAAVRAYFDAAVRCGAEVLHEPREWPEYHESYFGAFVRNPDGNDVEAIVHH